MFAKSVTVKSNVSGVKVRAHLCSAMLTVESHFKINVTHYHPGVMLFRLVLLNKQQVLVNIRYTQALQLVHLVIVSLNYLQPEFNPYEGHISQVF